MNHVAIRLKELHAMGYAHRDLKPGNVMWLPRKNKWTIIDFGCVARTGASANMGFTLMYAAPEVIAAYRRGARTMVAQVRCEYIIAHAASIRCCPLASHSLHDFWGGFLFPDECG